MKLVSEAVEDVVNYNAEAQDTTLEELDAAEEEDMVVVVDVEADMAAVVGIIQLEGGANQIK